MIGAILAKKAARDAFAAMNRHDLDAFMEAWGDDPVFEFPAGSVLGGRYRGRRTFEAGSSDGGSAFLPPRSLSDPSPWTISSP